MPFGLPKSLIWFAATGAVYLLQLFPYTGIFLMFALAPFWSVILVNVGFVSLALEALARPRHILWLIAPALYFGGYAGAAYLSHAEFDRIDAELHEHNAKAMAAAPQFDHSRNDLVVVMLEQINYLLRLRNQRAPYGMAAYSVSQIKEPLPAVRSQLPGLKGVGKSAIKIIREILDTGGSSYYDQLLNP